MGLNIEYNEGQTPLDEEEKEGLLIPTITTRGELDEVEQRNIENAIRWTIERRKKFNVNEILSEQFVRLLHVKMLGGVWKWAGSFRNSNKNIGVDKLQISIALRVLLDDCRYWVDNKVYSPDEIAIRFKHRIVSIHCFANGNGRHSRLIADVIIEKLFGREVFTWGGRDLIQRDGFRNLYLGALRKADRGIYEPLITFSRS
ncbi:mobile mystery protein B [Chitinophaga sp. SYP-B3965]|uniref:mobile mystery protein B n=1 Tax=Chitinophaga sp. SYP-B3965 TaxID=2663120 RepID=UPI00129A0072|nr:mobile mystery protein B [Chitinophaga sp. SYP-B3965]MRG46941.1 mobile mystery protein B [Chitinophaga sp. SYP-B3965]